MRSLGSFLRQCFVVELACAIRVETQIELIFPAKLEARLRECIVAQLCPGPSLGKVRGVRGNPVADDTFANVFLIWETEMLLRRYIAEHRSSIPADLRRADGASDVVISGSDVGDEWPQCIKWGLEAMLQFLVHILLYAMHGYVPWAFDHHLHFVLPCAFCQFSQRS